MNKTMTLLSALAITTVGATTFAQQCENGVCRIPRGFRTDTIRSPFNAPSGNNNVFRTRFQPPVAFPDQSPRNTTACTNCNCRSNDCNCGPNCRTHCLRSNSLRPEVGPGHDALPNDFLRPPGRSSFQAPQPKTNYARPAAYRSTVSWETDFRRAVDSSRQSGRPMLIRFGADWCGHCQRMKRETYSDRQIIADLNRAYIAVDLDADANQELVKRFRITSLPTTLVVAPDLRIIDRQEGYRTAEQLSQTISRFIQRAQLDREVRVACKY